MQWSKVADYAQRSVAFVLFGMTIYGTSLLARGGWRIWNRRRQNRKALESQQENNTSADENSSNTSTSSSSTTTTN